MTAAAIPVPEERPEPEKVELRLVEPPVESPVREYLAEHIVLGYN